MDITKFTLNEAANTLSIVIAPNRELNYSFEFLRVFSPSEWKKSQPATPKVFHKKQVKLTRIESVGKHGYRLLFDDTYQDLFSAEYLIDMASQHQALWSKYLEQTNNAANNREQAINIKQL